MSLSKILDRERARLNGILTDIRDVDTMRDAMDSARDEAARYRAANLMMDGTVRRLREDLARERSVCNDQWAGYQRMEADRDYWQREAEVLSAKLRDTNALLDRLMHQRGRAVLDAHAATASPQRAVKGGVSA